MTRNTKLPIEVNVFAATPNYQEQSKFALDTGVKALEFFEVFFDIPYPLQKIGLFDFPLKLGLIVFVYRFVGFGRFCRRFESHLIKNHFNSIF
jgi:aminopeptidase N